MARTVKQQVLDIIRAAGSDGASANEIAPQVNRPADSVRRIVGTLRSEGQQITLTGNGYVISRSVADVVDDVTDLDEEDEDTQDELDA
jgi:hypothetical protein